MALRFGLLGTCDHINLVVDGAVERDDIEFVGMYEPDKERGKEISEKLGIKLFDKKGDLHDAGIDVAGMFLPFSEKAEETAACIERGIHVFTDKPLATNVEGLGLIRNALDAHPDVVLTMGLTCRAAPAYRKLRELIKNGAIGVPATLTARRSYLLKRGVRPAFMFDSSLSGGIWVELAIHDIDFIRWTLGREFEWVSATHGNVSAPGEPFQDFAAGVFGMEHGTTVFIEENRLVPEAGPGQDTRVSAVGSEGRIDYVVNNGEVVLWNGSSVQQTIRDFPERISMFDNFVDAIRSGTELLVPTEDVLIGTAVSLEAFASAEEDGTRRTIRP